MAGRPFDVVVWGASGFTGRLVCEHLVRDYQGRVKWAMAGRSQQKLEQVRQEIGKEYNLDLQVPILTADLGDQSSMDQLAGQATVVLSTAGPFARIGTPVVDAAVRMGTHYCDITGETPWVKQMIDRHHEEAAARGVRIVHCCAYDSIPADLGTLLVANHMREALGKAAASVTAVITAYKGGVSGGTLATGMTSVAIGKEEGAAGRQYDSRSVYQLLPAGAPHGSDAESWSVGWQPVIRTWMSPWLMQVCDNKIVHRSDYFRRYGPDLHYREALGARSWLNAKAMQLGMFAAMAAFSQTWAHPLLRKVVPAQGEGPARSLMFSGRWKHTLVGETQEEGGAAPTTVVAEVGDDHRDAGYWGTARMVLESALCLALDRSKLDAAPGLQRGGVLTPASAMGEVLLERLRAAGMFFRVMETLPPTERAA